MSRRPNYGRSARGDTPARVARAWRETERQTMAGPAPPGPVYDPLAPKPRPPKPPAPRRKPEGEA